jgi:predicted nucleotidyltransferase
MVNILTWLQQEILRLFFKYAGEKLNQRQIAKKLNVSQPAVKKALPSLEKQRYIISKKDKETKRWSIELNLDNTKVMQIKRVGNLREIYDSGLVDFLEQNFPGTTIILFGSYSRGEDLINSDIDIAVIGTKPKNIDFSRFEKKFMRKININFYTSFSKIHKSLKENLANGILLNGGFEL